MGTNQNNLGLDDYGINQNKPSKIRKTGQFIWEMLKVVIISLIIIIPIRYFLIQPFYVKGASMEPNFYDQEYLIIDEITYRFSPPKRGDIVVFRYPLDPQNFFIKRVIGLPGERVKVENGQVFVAKSKDAPLEPLDESYLPADIKTDPPVHGYSDVTLGSDQYFVLGDNRDKSMDSRIFGPVAKDLIVGRTWLRGWPLNRLTIFNTPTYNNLK